MIRRGVAMLLVLVVLVVAVAAATNVARVSVAGQLAEDHAEGRAVCEDLRRQAEKLCRVWLSDESSRVVLPPDADRPTTLIANDRIDSESGSFSLQIIAVDLLGTVPVRTEDSSMMSALPSDVRDALRDLPDPALATGLDMVDRDGVVRGVYPSFPIAEKLEFGRSDQSATDNENSGSIPFEFASLPSFAEVAAFVRLTPPRRRLGGSFDPQTVSLNINTAPAPLLAAALASADIDAIDTIMTARAEGEPATLEARVDDDSPIRFVTRSTLWGFRIETRVGSVSSAWWVVFEQAGGAWKILRRLPIHD